MAWMGWRGGEKMQTTVIEKQLKKRNYISPFLLYSVRNKSQFPPTLKERRLSGSMNTRRRR